MNSAVQTAIVTIISYKPLSGLNLTRYTGQYGSYMPSSPLGVYKPLVKLTLLFLQCIVYTSNIIKIVVIYKIVMLFFICLHE